MEQAGRHVLSQWILTPRPSGVCIWAVDGSSICLI
ncbi:MAG: competence protein ComS [Lysobacterales bacterium]